MQRGIQSRLHGVRPQHTILIVEDDADLRRLYRTSLTFAGFHVREACDGLEALQALDRNPPDLVVLDLMLPVLSGYVVRKELADQAYTRYIPVVVVTGTNSIELSRFKRDCVLTKPVSSEQLVKTVRLCLAGGDL